jgi:tetratricopeptide (TPR) repeat protein
MPVQAFPVATVQAKPSQPKRERRDDEAERAQAEQLVLKITQHRQAGRSALLIGDLDSAFDELWRARELEPNLDHLGAIAREAVPREWELETDLTPLARALCSRTHPRAADAWRRVLEDRPARSIQAEAAEWLARDAFGSGQARAGLRMLHAANQLGRRLESDAFLAAYKQAGLDPSSAFSLYLAATRLDVHSARANGLRDPLTDQQWSDQDPRWWLVATAVAPRRALPEQTDHQLEAFSRARDLTHTKRDQGWLMLAEGDLLAGPLGVRTLGRNVRAGCAEPADHDTFVRIRLAYEGAADRLPDVAWPWYRLAELLARAGFAERAREQLAQAERRSLGARNAERVYRPLLLALVESGLGMRLDGMATAARPFPAEPFAAPLTWRLRLR